MALFRDVKSKGLVRRQDRTPTLDGLNRDRPGVGRYAEPAVLSFGKGLHNVADDGSYWASVDNFNGNPIQCHATFTDGSWTLAIFNNDTVGVDARRLYLDYVSFVLSNTIVITDLNFAIHLDPDQSKAPNGASQLDTQCANLDVNARQRNIVGGIANTPPCPAILWLNQTAMLLSPKSRLVARGKMRGSAQAATDEYVISFGGKHLQGGIYSSGNPGRFVSTVAPVTVGPQAWLLFSFQVPGSAGSAFSGEFQVGFWVR